MLVRHQDNRTNESRFQRQLNLTSGKIGKPYEERISLYNIRQRSHLPSHNHVNTLTPLTVPPVRSHQALPPRTPARKILKPRLLQTRQQYHPCPRTTLRRHLSTRIAILRLRSTRRQHIRPLALEAAIRRLVLTVPRLRTSLAADKTTKRPELRAHI